MTAYTITKADEGTSIATNGTLQSIIFTNPPAIPGDWFTLVDNSTGFDVQLYNMQTSSMPFPLGMNLIGGTGIPFTNLTVQSISVGSQVAIVY